MGQQLRLQPRPLALAAAHRQIDAVARQIDHRVIRHDPHGEVRVAHLEGADARRQPEMRETVGAAYAQHRRMILGQRGKALPHLVEGAGQDRRDLAPLLGQRHLAPGSLEQADAQPLLQQFHLIADRRLGHPQLLRGGREIFQPRGGLEHANGGQGRQRRHAPFDKPGLSMLSMLLLAPSVPFGQRQRCRRPSAPGDDHGRKEQ